MRTSMLVAGVVLAACGGGGSAPATTPVASAGEAALAFLRAAADSNVGRMAELWGTANGPAVRTNQPPDYQRRIVVIQTFLKNDSSRVVGQAPVAGDDSRRTVTVAFWREGCMRQLPFTVVRTRDGAWLVLDAKLDLAGNPARPCEGEPPPPADRSIGSEDDRLGGFTR